MATSTATRTRSSQKSGTAETREVLVNPFKEGDTLTLPSGTVFTSTNPSLKGRQRVKRSHQVKIAEVIPSRVAPRNSQKGSKVLVRPVRLRAKGSGGYFKDVTLNEKLVRLNGKTPEYETITLELDSEA